MKFFRVNGNINSYWLPILKIVISIILIVIVLCLNSHFRDEKTITRVVAGAICVVLIIGSVLCIYLSVAEVLIAHDNRTKNVKDIDAIVEKSRLYSTEEIVSIVNDNDIIALRIISNGEIIEIGASADNKPGSSVFFDKLYYIGDREFEHIGDFEKNLQALSDNGKVVVISIDDCPPPDCS
mgnify:FL=1